MRRGKKRDKKTVVIIALLVLLAVTGIGWLSAALEAPPETVPHGNMYDWTEFFSGYEAYLDCRIYPATMTTTSMTPTINTGDTILWVKVENVAELKVGDIIVFKHPTKPIDNVCHRIVEVLVEGGTYKFRTKGDNLSKPDQHLVPEANVHGLVIGVIYQRSS